MSSSQRPLPHNKQHSQPTNIHVPGGIRTRNLSRRAATWTGWLIPLGGEIRPWVLGNLIYEVVQVRKRGEDWFESLLNIRTPLQCFYLRLFYSVAKRKLFLGRKNIRRGAIARPPRPSPKLRHSSSLHFYENEKCLERMLWRERAHILCTIHSP